MSFSVVPRGRHFCTLAILLLGIVLHITALVATEGAGRFNR